MQMKRSLQGLFMVVLVTGSVMLGYMVASGFGGGDARTGAYTAPLGSYDDVAPAAVTRPAFYELSQEPDVPVVTMPDFADIFERVSPAVVSISATKFTDSSRDQERFFQDPFHWFFGQPDRDGRRPDQPRREESGGTGFVITPDGYILTNYHVVEDADRVRVRVRKGDDTEEREGRVVGTDPPTDIALVKIEPEGELEHLPLGNSDDLRVGEWVMAIGHPFFYVNTVTVGIVSAKGRRLDGLSRDPSLDNYIQTDAAINVGNSGGPLLNLRGEVVGINTAVSRLGQGIGFAVPINMAKMVVPQLRESGRVARGAIGVTIADISTLDAEDREYFGLTDLEGALVQNVSPGEPAEEAGVRPGDAIIAADGEPLDSSGDLIGRISAKRPGETIELTILRENRRLTKRVLLEDREEIWFQQTAGEVEEGSEPRRSRLYDQIGIQVEEITPEISRQFRLERGQEGVVITDVSVRGEAYEKGLTPGTVILEVNRRPVSSVDDYLDALDKVEDGELVSFYVQRGGSRSFVTFRVRED
jgi:serine protease Do